MRKIFLDIVIVIIIIAVFASIASRAIICTWLIVCAAIEIGLLVK
jgi:hypothetical protein